MRSTHGRPENSARDQGTKGAASVRALRGTTTCGVSILPNMLEAGASDTKLVWASGVLDGALDEDVEAVRRHSR